MKYLILALLAIALAGCAAPKATLHSSKTDMLVIGQEPAGYPKTYVEPYKGFPGYCLQVTESWRKDSYQGQTIWFKDKAIKAMPCPARG